MSLQKKTFPLDVQTRQAKSCHSQSICPLSHDAPLMKARHLVAWLLSLAIHFEFLLTRSVKERLCFFPIFWWCQTDDIFFAPPETCYIWFHTSHEVTLNTHGGFLHFPYHQDFPSWNDKFNTICFNLWCFWNTIFWIRTPHTLKFLTTIALALEFPSISLEGGG